MQRRLHGSWSAGSWPVSPSMYSHHCIHRLLPALGCLMREAGRCQLAGSFWLPSCLVPLRGYSPLGVSVRCRGLPSPRALHVSLHARYALPMFLLDPWPAGQAIHCFPWFSLFSNHGPLLFHDKVGDQVHCPSEGFSLTILYWGNHWGSLQMAAIHMQFASTHIKLTL